MTTNEKLLDALKEAEEVQAQVFRDVEAVFRDVEAVFRDVEAAARSAYSKTLATSSGAALDIFVRIWFGLERLSYESDEQLRERCEAKMRREFKP